MKRNIVVLLVLFLVGCTEPYPSIRDYFLVIRNSTSKKIFIEKYFKTNTTVDTILLDSSIFFRLNLREDDRINDYVPIVVERMDSIKLNFNKERFTLYKKLNITNPPDLYNINSYSVNGDSLIYTITQADYDNATPY